MAAPSSSASVNDPLTFWRRGDARGEGSPHLTIHIATAPPAPADPPSPTTNRAARERSRPALIPIGVIFLFLFLDIVFIGLMAMVDGLMSGAEKKGKKLVALSAGRMTVTVIAGIYSGMRSLDLYTRTDRFYYDTQSQLEAQSEGSTNGTTNPSFLSKNRRYLWAMSISSLGFVICFVAKYGFEGIVSKIKDDS